MKDFEGSGETGWAYFRSCVARFKDKKCGAYTGIPFRGYGFTCFIFVFFLFDRYLPIAFS